MQSQTPRLDPALLPFLRAKGEAETDRQLAALFAAIDPAIRRIVARRWGVHAGSSAYRFQSRQGISAEDLHGSVRLRITKRLRELKANPEKPIEDLRAYIVTTIYNLAHDLERMEHPQRSSLKAEIYECVQGSARLASWIGRDRKLVCGLTEQRSAEPKPLPDDPRAFVREALPGEMVSAYRLHDLVVRILEYVDSPVDLNALVDFAAELQGMTDQPIADLDEAVRVVPDLLPDPGDEVALRALYRRVWDGICRLPLAPRIAYLLNGEVCALLQEMHAEGVIRLQEVAAGLELSLTECAELWSRLPLPDLEIARRLGIEEKDAPPHLEGGKRRHWVQQQVINLRQAARRALAAWMRS